MPHVVPEPVYKVYHHVWGWAEGDFIKVKGTVWSKLKWYASKATAMKGAEYTAWLSSGMYGAEQRRGTWFKAFKTDHGWGVFQKYSDCPAAAIGNQNHSFWKRSGSPAEWKKTGK